MIKAKSSTFQERFCELVGETATQEEIAKIVNSSRQNVGNWLSGKSKPDIYALVEIAKGYNVSTDYLLGITDVKSSNVTEKAICDYTGLTEGSIQSIVDSTSKHLFCKRALNHIIESLYDGLLFIIDENAFLHLKQYMFEKIVLKKYLNEHYPKIPNDEIDLRGIYIFEPHIGHKWFGKDYKSLGVKLDFNKYLEEMKKQYKIIDPDLVADTHYKDYKMKQDIDGFLDDIKFEYFEEEKLCSKIIEYYSTAILGTMTEAELTEYYSQHLDLIDPLI